MDISTAAHYPITLLPCFSPSILQPITIRACLIITPVGVPVYTPSELVSTPRGALLFTGRLQVGTHAEPTNLHVTYYLTPFRVLLICHRFCPIAHY